MTRTIREGLVGILILVGLGLFGGLTVWLSGTVYGQKKYQFQVSFANAIGMQIGTKVRYRGVTVGRINTIRPDTNNIMVTVEINDPNLLIPRNSTIEVNKAGLIGDTSIDITPNTELVSDGKLALPLSSECDRQKIICHNETIKGIEGVSIEQAIKATVKFTDVYSDPNIVKELKDLLSKGATTADEIKKLTADLSRLSKVGETELVKLSQSAQQVSKTANTTLSKVNQTLSNADKTLATFTETGLEFKLTAQQLNITAKTATKTINQVDQLIAQNGTTLVSTLNNINGLAIEMRGVVKALGPTVNNLASGKLIKNLEEFSSNAAEAAKNIKNATRTLNNPLTVLTLKRTLDSARATFQNAEKITADLDELTGDPNIRNNIRKLINSLGQLVSSTQKLEQQVKIRESLVPLSQVVNPTHQPVFTSRPNPEPIGIILISNSEVPPSDQLVNTSTNPDPNPSISPTPTPTPTNILFPPLLEKSDNPKLFKLND